MYNVMTCAGFGTEVFGGCTMAWLGFALLIFAVLIARRQLTDYTEFPFNIVGGMVGGVLPFLILITITGSFRWAFMSGFIGMFIGGYFGSLFLEGEE